MSYRLQKALIWLCNQLPFGLMYLFADLLWILVYYGTNYRKSVVRQNLERSFPNRTLAERKRIEKAFYRYLAEQLLETFRAFDMRAEEVNKRVKVLNPEVMDELHERGLNVVHVLGHHANWEWYAHALALNTKHWLFFVYKKLNNPGFNRLIIEMREKFGAKAVPMKFIFKTIEATPSRLHASFFGGDQSPMQHNRFIWLPFLHQPTAVYLGAEDIAKKYNAAVVFGKMRRVKRGYYTIELELITDKPRETAFGEITKAHSRILEAFLEEQPEYWLWSHKRWKLDPAKHQGHVA